MSVAARADELPYLAAAFVDHEVHGQSATGRRPHALHRRAVDLALVDQPFPELLE
jgi:hypothetical protein